MSENKISECKSEEWQLYGPIKEFLQERGYSVKGEVKECDIVAKKEDKIVIVEMKKSLNFKLLMQGALRQRIGDAVYVAIERPKKSMFSKEWNDKKYLLKRLQLGLIIVNKKKVEIVLEPKEFNMIQSKKKNMKKRSGVVEEFHKRTGDFNLGGVGRKKIITAYREEAIKIAYFMKDGEKTIKELKGMGASDKTASILQKNFYNWFKRVDRGVYALTDEGENSIEGYKHITEELFYKNIEPCDTNLPEKNVD